MFEDSRSRLYRSKLGVVVLFKCLTHGVWFAFLRRLECNPYAVSQQRCLEDVVLS